MRNKHTSGFVPIPFKLAGRIFFPASIVMIIAGGLDQLLGWGKIPAAVLFCGAALLVLSLYLLRVVPRE